MLKISLNKLYQYWNHGELHKKEESLPRIKITVGELGSLNSKPKGRTEEDNERAQVEVHRQL
jgi:hypothetical protein